MQVRYNEIVGKRLVTADGKSVGRITDLLARAEGDALVVNALLVGPGGLMRRIGFKQLGNVRPAPVQRIPWAWVERIADAVHLCVSDADVGKAGKVRPEDEIAIGAAARGKKR